MLRSALQRRWIATVPVNRREAWLFVDSVFPVKLGTWDVRYYVGLLRQDFLLSSVLSKLTNVKQHNFQVIDVEPHPKDGGVYVRFSYTEPAEQPDSTALQEIEESVREEANRHGGFPTWTGVSAGNAWLVRGQTWREDMNRYASNIVKVTFEGPDVPERVLYHLFRPYGRIKDIALPTSVPAGTPRSALITYSHVRSAVIARNVLYGLDTEAQDTKTTTLRTGYQKPIQAHAVRDWMSKHPKIILPIIVFLLGSLTYTIFDPIRSVMVQGKLLDWFDYKQYNLYKWLRANTLDRLSQPPRDDVPITDVWKERSAAQDSLKNYLNDVPSSIAFMHGPQGSGKSTLVRTVLSEYDRNVLYIDCRMLQKAGSDSQLVNELAHQTGYWPVFTLFNSMGNLIDLASVGLIGQKVGLTSSLPDQLQQILGVVTQGLKRAADAKRSDLKERFESEERHNLQIQESRRIQEGILNGTWHDGRLECVAGIGPISELAIGDEPFDPELDAAPFQVNTEHLDDVGEKPKKEKSQAEIDAIRVLPIVVVLNYATKIGSTQDELLKSLADWAASLVENQIAHVLVLSDNRENAKRLAKALPSKPLYAIGLSDADPSSSLLFMKEKLSSAGIDVDFSAKQTAQVMRLGGRASDLESLIHKVRSGQSVEDAVEEIIHQGVGELRKNAFGDDTEDAQSLPWAREQAWTIIKSLAVKPELSYHELLSDFPFKGDEAAIRNMEHAEFITVTMKDGRPSTIKPGKPVLRWVFERMVKDPIFQAVQDINYNDKAIAKAENTIKACEEELRVLGEIMATEPRSWYDALLGRRSACKERAKFLARKMLKAEKKVETLERRNDALKRSLTTAM
ncbi:exonuclease [Coprinopsis cinerea okayama7|uniref:Mitochondrial escape protein 2 n=1 Tax=Coprinopsis cinerea (strain Okayama-7 / 130 / ATCC MYA-4618 / FGSC 9003) TaxID=240176 RepID=D6RKQ8_COPC7|nr:exonuclease [Coprinopsis cinerea okayama7\|eukprot:XP_002911910.1 exonuclease [Coprinopsis cinerea okayama7\